MIQTDFGIGNIIKGLWIWLILIIIQIPLSLLGIYKLIEIIKKWY